MKRKVCVITGSRAEYGLLRWLMHEIEDDQDLELQIIATGTHLSHEFGLTYREIEADGFKIDKKIEMLLSSDSSIGIIKSMGLGLIGFADALDSIKPEVIVVLGDRFEILVAAQAAMMMNIPIAHISGGEITEGVVDDRIRNALTKLSDFHFPANEDYRKRIIQMGENPSFVLNFGDPGLDSLVRLELISKEKLEADLDFKLGKINFLVTFHPLTLSPENSFAEMSELLLALDFFPEAHIILTKPNADMGGRSLSELVDVYFANNRDRVYVCSSLGSLKYLSAIKLCDVVIGNSSSGIVEAPALKKPSVNIGNRQTGRLKAESIIDCQPRKEYIKAAIEKALSSEFQNKLNSTTLFYSSEEASRKIKNYLKEIELDSNKVKIFNDIKWSK